MDDLQRNSWLEQIRQLKELLVDFHDAYVFFEFSIPRMGKRADVILVLNGLIFVLEYKVGTAHYDNQSILQTTDYALDLKNFHEGSHDKTIIPILVSTNAEERSPELIYSEDHVANVLCANKETLGEIISYCIRSSSRQAFDPVEWSHSIYKPTPTIVEAAQALYRGHHVDEISRSDAGAINLSHTNQTISEIIENTKHRGEKSICFMTGVPGAGKTLAGLNIVSCRTNADEEEHAVFLSGNGPLVDVLREALAIDEVTRSKEDPALNTVTMGDARRKAWSFIQNIHHFRDDNLRTDMPPIEKVVVFDEAQRAWNKNQTSKFMKEKRAITDFDMSEPDFLLSVMNRHEGWCTVICLIGGGQEINVGEAGLGGWAEALRDHYSDWNVYCSENLLEPEYSSDEDINQLLNAVDAKKTPNLHLSVSLRSFRAENLSNFVNALLCFDHENINRLRFLIEDYPIYLTRSLDVARDWLRRQARGSERAGLVASANARRLKPLGINVKERADPKNWFLKDKNDIRSSSFLEDVATEFDIQGLELDWIGVCWGADLRFNEDTWSMNKFSGSKWQNVNAEERRRYLLNAYRVLLTRARQGMVIFVPEGDENDHTRLPEFYDTSFEYLRSLNIPCLD